MGAKKAKRSGVPADKLAYGAVMNEYVTVPDDLLGKTKQLQKYLSLSYEYAKGLKPKPTKKKN